MTYQEQLNLWATGVNKHNDQLDVCCPDFACCQPTAHFSLEQCAKFLEFRANGNDGACHEMLMISVQQALSSLGRKDKVHVAGQQNDTELH
jgi:hypothetical protein